MAYEDDDTDQEPVAADQQQSDDGWVPYVEPQPPQQYAAANTGIQTAASPVPPQSSITDWAEQPAAAAPSSITDWAEQPPAAAAPATDDDKWQPYVEPQAEGIFGTIARQYAHQILPTAAAIGAGVLAAPLGLGAIPVAVGTYMGASKLQDEGLKALGIDDNAKIAANAAAHPVASAVGDIAMAATPWGIGSDIALARRGLGAAVGTAVEGYNQYQQGQFDPTRLAVAAGTGAIFNKPRAGTAALEGALARGLGRGAPAAPAAPTAPTADIPEPVPPAQGQLPGIGGGERQPELPLDTPSPVPGKQPLAPGEYEPQLPFEPPTIDEQGQYGFHGITADPMPETGGVAKESAPPPAGDQPRNNAWRYAKDKPIRDEGGGTNVLQPGQVDPAIASVVSPPQTSTPEIDAAVSRVMAPEPPAAAAAAARPPDTVSQAPAPRPQTVGDQLKAAQAARVAAATPAARPEPAAAPLPSLERVVAAVRSGEMPLSTGSKPMSQVARERIVQSYAGSLLERAKTDVNLAQQLRSLENQPAVPSRTAAAIATGKRAAAAAPRDVVSAAPARQAIPDTRGQGRQYHGAPDEVSLNEGHYGNSRSYYGTQSLYTTDALDVANGYANRRSAKNPTLYEVTPRAGARIYDMERPIEPALRAHLETMADSEYGNTPELIGQILDENPKNLRELFDSIREQAASNRVPADEVQEDIFHPIQDFLEGAGYQGMSHKGGLRTKTPEHNVTIYFSPEKNVNIRSMGAAELTAPPAIRTAGLLRATAQPDLNEIPDFLKRTPARRSAVEQAANRPGGLPAATEALMQRIGQRIDDINSGRVQPGPGEVQRLAITRAQLNARRTGAAPAVPAARPQVVTHDGARFSGATVPEAAVRAAAAGYRPHQIFNTDGTPYTVPRPGAAPAAAPSGRAPPGGAPPRGPTPPAGATPPAGKGATVKSTLAPAMKSDLQTGVLASLRRNLGGLVLRGSESAQKAQTALRNAIGPLARLKEQTLYRFTNEMHKLGNSMDKPAFERFVDAYESGRVATLPKDQQELGNVFAKNYGDFLKEINNRPGVEQMEGVKDYLTHMYDNSTGQVDKFASDWYGGGGGSLKQRTHPTFADARAAGLQPLSHNPIEHFTRYSEGISHYLAQRNMMADLENQHMIGYFGPKVIGASGAPEPQVIREPPEGYSKIDMPWAQKNGRQAYAPRDIAETINQFYNKGLQRAQTKDIYNFLQQTKNMWTAVELGFSGYHALTVGVESMASGQARALQLAGSGRYAEAAAQLLKTPAEPVTSYLYGRTGRQIYRDTTGTVGDPTARKIIGYFAKANIQPGNLRLTGEYDMSRLGNLWDSYKRGSLMNEFQAQLKSVSDSYGLKLPAVLLENVRRAVQTLSKPLFEHYIPELKLGTMMKDMEAWMGSNPNATEEQAVAYAQRISDSVDNRMGEMNYDNMFINKTARNLGTLALRSFGFTVGGPFREIGAGAGRLGLTAAQGKNPLSHLDLRSAAADPRTAYALAYLPTIAAIGAVYQLLRTGKGPEDWRDLITPKTGGMVKSAGKTVPERMEPPGYQKDFLGYFVKPYVDPEAMPLDELKNKMAAPWTALWEQLTGRDWRNQKYVPPRATALESLKAHAQQLGSHMLPIGPKQLAEGRKPGSQLTIPEQMLGVRTPGAYMLNPKGLEQFLSQKQQRDYAADRKRQGLPPRPLPPAPR